MYQKFLELKFSETHRVIISIGSNSSPEKHVQHALKELSKLFNQQIRFSPMLYTESIGMETPSIFLNTVGIGHTSNSLEHLQQYTKQIEQQLGRKKGDKQKGIIPIDIDILQWDNEILKPQDLDYPFIKECLRFFE